MRLLHFRFIHVASAKCIICLRDHGLMFTKISDVMPSIYQSWCQVQNFRGQRCRVIDKKYTPERSNVLPQRGILLSDSINPKKKASAASEGCRSRVQLNE